MNVLCDVKHAGEDRQLSKFTMGVVKVVYLLFKQEDPFCADYLGTEAATIGVPWKKVFLEILQNSPENNCARVSFLIKLQVLVCNFIKKESLAQVFSFEFCEISKNNFFTEHLRTTASVDIFRDNFA